MMKQTGNALALTTCVFFFWLRLPRMGCAKAHQVTSMPQILKRIGIDASVYAVELGARFIKT